MITRFPLAIGFALPLAPPAAWNRSLDEALERIRSAGAR